MKLVISSAGLEAKQLAAYAAISLIQSLLPVLIMETSRMLSNAAAPSAAKRLSIHKIIQGERLCVCICLVGLSRTFFGRREQRIACAGVRTVGGTVSGFGPVQVCVRKRWHSLAMHPKNHAIVIHCIT